MKTNKPATKTLLRHCVKALSGGQKYDWISLSNHSNFCICVHYIIGIFQIGILCFDVTLAAATEAAQYVHHIQNWRNLLLYR